MVSTSGRQCEECGFDWYASPADLISTLRSASTRLDLLLKGVGEVVLRKRATPKVWSALEYAAHVRDVVAWYETRIVRVLTEDRPRLAAVDWSVKTDERRYHLESIDTVLLGVTGSADSLANLLGSLEASQWRRVGIGSDGGERDVAVLARRAVHEVEHHIVDVRRQRDARSEQSR